MYCATLQNANIMNLIDKIIISLDFFIEVCSCPQHPFKRVVQTPLDRSRDSVCFSSDRMTIDRGGVIRCYPNS